MQTRRSHPLQTLTQGVAKVETRWMKSEGGKQVLLRKVVHTFLLKIVDAETAIRRLRRHFAGGVFITR
jgi:hypothetical protein